MEAPELISPDLQLERVRCVCQTENLLVWPASWYVGQASVEVDEVCASCGRSLLGQVVPEGAVLVRFTAITLPDSIARALGSEVVEEYCRNRAVVTEGEVEVWSQPHQAGEAYEKWLDEQRPVAASPSSYLVQNLAITAVLAIVVALLAVL